MGNCSMNPTPFVQVGDYEFDPNDVISAGHHGVLFMGSPKDDKMFEIAIKQVTNSFDEDSLSKVERIVKKLMSVSHENIASYIDYYYDRRNNKLYLIIEFCAHGNLNDMLQGEHSPIRDIKTAIQYCQQIIKGVVALHEKGVIHQNLRPQNILIHYDTLKISDFGLTELEELSVEGSRKKYSIYRAPEVFMEDQPPTQKCDIWSLGVILYQIMYKERPLEVTGGRHMFCDVKRGKCAVLDDLINRCLQLDPNDRIGTRELQEHPFLKLDSRSVKEYGFDVAGMP